MTALLLSFFVLAYILVPGILFRIFSGLFVPLKKFQRTRTEEITFAVVAALGPFLFTLALVYGTHWFGHHPFLFSDSAALKWHDYRSLFASTYSENFFRENQAEFWASSARIFWRQLRFVMWYYPLLIFEAVLFGWLSQQYGRLRRAPVFGPIYEAFARKFFLPSISEWHVLLTPFTFSAESRREVHLDLLVAGDRLYRGEVANYFVDREGNLSGILLENAFRFDRQNYLNDKNEGKARSASEYWKAIPGANLYVPGRKIINLNLRYEPPMAEAIGEMARRLHLAPRLSVTPMHRGALHILRHQEEPPLYTIAFAPYDAPGGVLKSRNIGGREALVELLNKFGVPSDSIESTLEELAQQAEAVVADVWLADNQLAEYSLI